MSIQKLHVAVVGGGLCGISLAIALEKRSISYTIYEARGSFTEIGAGINLGPNTIQAFNLIDSAISDAISAMATRNEPGKEDVWMSLFLGSPTERFDDVYPVHEIKNSLTGNMTVSRNEILQLLASNINHENARFNKKLSEVWQSDDGVTLTFEGGTTDTASVVIGCDGAHSAVRRLLLGADHPAATAKYSETGGYRAVFPMQVFEEIVGADKAHNSTLLIGPGGYVINYPIDGGKKVNLGLWPWKRGEWTRDAWVVPQQKAQMLEDFQAWGETTHKMMKNMDDETAFWATFHHSTKPESYFRGRICVIGDASHSMCPHQGQGAAQSMEDACVMAEVLSRVVSVSPTGPMAARIAVAFSAYEDVRKPRFERALDTSKEAFSCWSDFWRPDISTEDIEDFRRRADERFVWLWNPDIPGQCEAAKEKMRQVLDDSTLGEAQSQGNFSFRGAEERSQL